MTGLLYYNGCEITVQGERRRKQVAGDIGVVLVDGDREDRGLLQERLDACDGFRVLAAVADGAAALKAVRQLRPQYVIMELILQGMDGLTLLRELMQEGCPPKVIVLSRWINQDMVSAALSRGASYYLTKPCNVGSLAEQMRESCRSCAAAFVPDTAEAERITVETLRNLGVAPQCAGMHLARDMILLALAEPERLRAIAEKIYQPFLRDETDSVKRIERSLRYVIETAWNNAGAAEYQLELFGNTVCSKCGRPSNGAFLSVVTESVRMALRQQETQVKTGT